jgi:hypothetical protein
MSTLGKVVGAMAPALGTILNAALPGSGLIISGLSALFNVNSETDLVKAIQTDPDSALKLVQFQEEHKYDLERIYAADRASARQMAIETAKATGHRDWVQSFIAIFLIIGFFSTVMIVAFTKMDQTDHDILYLLVGQLSGAFLLVVSFFFGSSTSPQPARIITQTQAQANLPPPMQTS